MTQATDPTPQAPPKRPWTVRRVLLTALATPLVVALWLGMAFLVVAFMAAFLNA